MTAKKDEGPGPIEFQSVFSHPDFDPNLDAPEIATPHFEPGEDIAIVAPVVAPPPAEVSVAPTKRAESAIPKEK